MPALRRRGGGVRAGGVLAQLQAGRRAGVWLYTVGLAQKRRQERLQPATFWSQRASAAAPQTARAGRRANTGAGLGRELGIRLDFTTVRFAFRSLHFRSFNGRSPRRRNFARWAWGARRIHMVRAAAPAGVLRDLSSASASLSSVRRLAPGQLHK